MLSPQYVAPSPRRVLDNMPTVSTSDPQQARETISSLFCAHELKSLSPRGQVKMHLRSTRSGFGVHLLDYGTAVRITPEPLETFFMVQVPLAGQAQMKVGAASIVSTPQIASIPPIDRECSMQWEAGTPQLIVTAPRETLTAAAASLYGANLQSPLRLAATMSTTGTTGQAFMRAVHDYHDLLNDASIPANSYTRRLQEEMVLARWLMAVDSNFSNGLNHWEVAPANRSSSDLVADFTALLEAHSFEDLSIGDLAEALGVSIRTLQVAVAREANSTPSQMLRDARLCRAHRMLLQADAQEDTVTIIAAACGFSHFGRFAQAYKRLYGFLPSQTLRSHTP